MGVFLDDNATKNFELILRIDTAVRCEDGVYDQYLENLDETLLNLDPEQEPTRFIFRRVLPWDAQQRVERAKVDAETRGINLGYLHEEVRASLIDIKGPGIKFQRDKDSLCSKELITKLVSAGVINDLVTARQKANTNSIESMKKKSQPSLSLASQTLES
jgi:hypothetical protein